MRNEGRAALWTVFGVVVVDLIGFGIVMPHFYKNWALDDLRTFILNGVVWTAKVNVPNDGVHSTKPDLAAFAPASIEPKPREPKPQPAKK